MDLITYALCKNLINKTLEGAGALSGKSAFDLAVENGFEGTLEEWLSGLKGVDGQTPHIGENGNWFIGDEDTGVNAGTDFQLEWGSFNEQ